MRKVTLLRAVCFIIILELITMLSACSFSPGIQTISEEASTDDRALVPASSRTDFRKETIYFLMTTRFYDGDSSTNVHCWDDAQARNPDSDPAWRGDFKGLIEKLDYIKALGFSAVWITPPVKNSSGYDYHGYHAINMMEIDPRYKTSNVSSAQAAYQAFIDAAHAKGMKVIQDIVFNHSGNFGEENLYPLFRRDAPLGLNDTIASVVKTDPYLKLPANYDTLLPSAQYSARIAAMKEDAKDTAFVYHHEKSLSWESYTVQTGQIAGDCVDLNTENPTVYNYMVSAAKKWMDMGIDGYRVDTVKHISRLSFNKALIPPLKSYGGSNFYIFGEVCTRYRDVWNSGLPPISAPFYTWKESKTYAWGDRATNEAAVLQNWNDNTSTATQPTINNAYLVNNAYHTPDWSRRSGMDVIDFPMHWSFRSAYDAFAMGKNNDSVYNDATWNVTYVDSHDYAPDGAPENQRFAQPTDTWAENLDLMFTFRGIPCIFYGTEIEFMKGAPIDVGPNAPLSTTGRAYFGDKITGSVTATGFGTWSSASGNMATTLNHPLSRHIQRLNLIRRSIPALQTGQYTTDGVSGNMAFKRRYTNGTDSFACVTISGNATFTGIPNGTYRDAITGASVSVTGGTLSTSGCDSKGDMRVYVLNGPGQIGAATQWLEGGTSPTPTPTTAPTPTPGTVPSTPLISSVNNATTSSLTVRWGAVSGALAYTVWRSSSSTGTYSALENTVNTLYSDTGLAAATTYWYKVSATNAAGSSALSAAVSGKTLADTGTTTTTIRIVYDVGLGNTMYVRGSVSPLSWTTGIAMTWTTGNVWTWSTTSIPDGTKFEFKGLINNATWSDGANFEGIGGTITTVYPTFNGNFYDTMDTLGNWNVTGFTGTGKWHISSSRARAYGCTSESLMTYKYSMVKTGTKVTLAFKYQVTGLDAGEYLAVDVSKDGGATWAQVKTITGTVSTATNTSVDVTAYKSTNFKLRFRTKMSSTTEYSYVDNVSVAVVK